MSNPSFSWLLFEGLLPLIGAGIIYILWGVFRYTATDNKASFKYQWWEAADPLGWLYGAVIIAVQSAFKGFSTKISPTLTWMCVLGGLACLLLLVAAMTDRGTNTSWKPPTSLQIFAALLVAVILYAGFEVHTPLATGVHP